MRVECNNNLHDKLHLLNSIVTQYFEYIEKSILEKGLIKSFEDDTFDEYVKILHDRNSYSHVNFKNYLHDLDRCFNFKSERLDHFNNQNIINLVSDEKLSKSIRDLESIYIGK